MKLNSLLFCLMFTAGLYAQETFPVNDVKDLRSGAYALTGATIYVDYQTKIENATLLIRDGHVVDAGKDLKIPADATTIDVSGKTIYPGLIDAYTSYGMPERKRNTGGFRRGPEQIQPITDGAYNANDGIKAQFNAGEAFGVKDKDAGSMRKLGFGAALTFRADGFARGTGAVVTLAKDTENNVMLNPKATAHLSFSRGTSRQNYPTSTMGAMALLRQTYHDAAWLHGLAEKPFTDQSLSAWTANRDLPHIFEARNWKDILRADRVGDEFGEQYIIKESGDSYQRIAEVKATGASLIVPVNFPDAYDVSDPMAAERVSLADMKHWELAPGNAATIAKNGIDFAFTSHGLGRKAGKSFWSNIRKAVKAGLSEQDALKALTHTPARFTGVDSRIGALKSGMIANFIITSGNLFADKTSIHENWIQGHRHIYDDIHQKDRSGSYVLKVGDTDYNLEVSGKPGKHALSIKNGDKKIKVKSKLTEDMVSLSFKPDSKAGTIRLSGWLEDKSWQGSGELDNGDKVAWSATWQGELEKDDKKGKAKSKNKDKSKRKRKGKGGDKSDPADVGAVTFPFLPYGWTEAPKQETILVKNATVWTNESDGILKETDVLVRDGKIAEIGKGLKARGAREIDGSGLHLTPGVIDEHSHIALDGVNDSATNSGMVRMKDVVDSEDVNIYRQLAGGVVAAQLLHGSANPIGGQSALIKFRWGHTPEKMLIENADGFIKFALGENVKRSRSTTSIRYPQTRMGVEQIYVDAFTAARDYEKEWKTYNALSDGDKAKAKAPRKDLAMDTMVEILNSERFITCHSYVTSEIVMLMRVAEQFDFRINTFTHILEGYKVADKMKAHGVGGSTFSDWWNYKWEVRYAIPYNPAIMHDEGVVVAVNSDSAEMARRLNQEAAKAIRYGGMTEEDALKLVTLNPAKLLHLDDRMGSVKVGKDADLVLWSDHPLSTYAQAQVTMVDGTVYFDRERDQELRTEIKAERARLIQKMLDAKKSGSPTRKPMGRSKIIMHCDTMGDHHMHEDMEDHHHD